MPYPAAGWHPLRSSPEPPPARRGLPSDTRCATAETPPRRGARARTAPALECRRTRLPALVSNQIEPFSDLVIGHVGPCQPVANKAVSEEIETGQAGIGLVPDVDWNLVTEDVVFELLFVIGTALYQPARLGVADPVAEQQIESPADLVDEIIHVGFQRAVVIAREKHLALPVEEDPPGEVDRLDPGEVAAVEQVPAAGIVHRDQYDRGQPPEQAGLQAADDDVRVGGVVILVPRDLGSARGIGARYDLRIGRFVPAPLPEEHRQGQQQEMHQ